MCGSIASLTAQSAGTGRYSSRTVLTDRAQGHNGVPVLDAAYDATGGLVATGAADRLVRVWDSGNGACTHNLKVRLV